MKIVFLVFFMNYYVDTCVWRDFYENRMGHGGRDLGKAASVCMLKLLYGKHLILYSDFIFKEMSKDYSQDALLSVFKVFFLSGKLQHVPITKKDILQAHNLKKRNLSFGDCLHAVLARKNEATIITQNVKDFSQLQDVVPYMKPENV